ncbi:MAG: 4-alpha-glucanotransferase [Gammaproteobacteria bacterium]
MSSTDFYQRRAGVLLHPTSLPSGVLDADADRWLDWLHEAGFGVWQVLPLGEPQHGLSPYQCISAFAMNPALLSSYTTPEPAADDFRHFCASSPWLDDYVSFKLLHQKFNTDPWYAWPDEYKFRQPDSLERLRHEFAQSYLQLQWQQFQLHERWLALKQSANNKGILLFGDMPLFVGHHSADVWANPDRFLIDKDGKMKVVAGVPPDYYSDTGQRWGNPHYNWDVMQAENYAWWIQRMRYHLDIFDVVRIDHFRGLEASWVINAACETAIDGHWEKMPGDSLLAAIREDIGHLPIVAEDLGIITPEVTALRKKYHLPGMSVLQFGFDAFEDNPHKPKNIELDRVVYTGTHDNDTTRGWFKSLPDEMKLHVLNVLGIQRDGSPAEMANAVVDRLVDIGMNSRGSLFILPMQDVLHLDSSARMNTPGTVDDNWQWSFQWQQLGSDIIHTMRQQIEKTGRLVIQHV